MTGCSEQFCCTPGGRGAEAKIKCSKQIIHETKSHKTRNANHNTQTTQPQNFPNKNPTSQDPSPKPQPRRQNIIHANRIDTQQFQKQITSRPSFNIVLSIQTQMNWPEGGEMRIKENDKGKTKGRGRRQHFTTHECPEHNRTLANKSCNPCHYHEKLDFIVGRRLAR